MGVRHVAQTARRDKESVPANPRCAQRQRRSGQPPLPAPYARPWPSEHPSQAKVSDCGSALNAMRCGKRCTSCGQPTATAILPAQYRAWASSGTSTTAKPPRCSLVSMNGPSVNRGEPLLGSTLHTTVDASRPPSLKTKTPASVISSITALADVAFSRSSSTVWSGTHSSLKAIRYSAIASSSAQWQPGRLPLTFSTNALGPIRHPGQHCVQASASKMREGRLLDHSPAAHVRRPRLDYESHATPLDRQQTRRPTRRGWLGPARSTRSC